MFRVREPTDRRTWLYRSQLIYIIYESLRAFTACHIFTSLYVRFCDLMDVTVLHIMAKLLRYIPRNISKILWQVEPFLVQMSNNHRFKISKFLKAPPIINWQPSPPPIPPISFHQYEMLENSDCPHILQFPLLSGYTNLTIFLFLTDCSVHLCQ